MAFKPGEDIRASHTIRIFGTNKAGDVLQDIWLDIERVDLFRFATQIDGHWQMTERRLKWMDDPIDNDGNSGAGNPTRARGTLQICSPDEADQEDPEAWVPVSINISMRFKESTHYGTQIVIRRNRNSAENEARRIAARRIWHRDTIIDSDVEAATSQNPDLRAYVVASDKYAFVADSDDKDNYLEVQYVSQTGEQIGIDSRTGAGSDQAVIFNLRNRYLLNISEEAKGPVNPAHGFDPPWALDPFQAIVNVQWAANEQAVLGVENFPIDYSDSTTLTSNDGLEWQDGFGTSSNAASGLGKTVVCSGTKYVAFGKPRAGAACFITAKDFTIQRGVPDDLGNLVWTTVASLPTGGTPPNAGAQSLAFAGGAFFVSYLKDADRNLTSYLAVSFDGENFTQNVKPFNGVIAAANGSGMDPGESDPNPIGGSVAYDKANKRYVTTGNYQRSYWNQQDIGAGDTAPFLFFDTNFMSSVSSNGTSWTPSFDTSECSGFPPAASGGIGGDRDGKPSVTFGNGRFIAATSFKLNYDFFTAPTFAPYQQTAYAAAVATSSNGTSWSNARLPGSQSTGWVYGDATASSGGNASCVKFFKTGKNASGVPGFFIAAALEYGGIDVLKSRLWQSEDAITWTLQRTDLKSDWILTAINKSRGTVVHRD